METRFSDKFAEAGKWFLTYLEAKSYGEVSSNTTFHTTLSRKPFTGLYVISLP